MKTVQHSVVRRTQSSTLVSYSNCVYSMKRKACIKVSIRTVLCVSVYVLYVDSLAKPALKHLVSLLLGFKVENKVIFMHSNVFLNPKVRL